MFEFSRNQKNTFPIVNHFDEWPLLQQRSVPTEPLTLSMHRYLLIESHRKPSVALWVHPFMSAKGFLETQKKCIGEGDVKIH